MVSSNCSVDHTPLIPGSRSRGPCPSVPTWHRSKIAPCRAKPARSGKLLNRNLRARTKFPVCASRTLHRIPSVAPGISTCFACASCRSHRQPRVNLTTAWPRTRRLVVAQADRQPHHLADDEFLNALSQRLQPSSVSSVSAERIRKMGHLPEGQHFILRTGSIGVGTASAKGGSQTTYQHPRCLTGQCVPPERGTCQCPCRVCQTARARARVRARLRNEQRGSGNVQLQGRPVSGLATQAQFTDYNSSCIGAAMGLRCHDRLR